MDKYSTAALFNCFNRRQFIRTIQQRFFGDVHPHGNR
jgi:hypothetical protein